MSYRIETTWAKRIEYDDGSAITMPTLKKAALDLVLMAAGATVMYGLGRLVGEGINQIPCINEWIPQAVEYVSGINVQGNIGGLTGLLGGLYGLRKSGVQLDKKTFEAKEIVLAPISIDVRSH